MLCCHCKLDIITPEHQCLACKEPIHETCGKFIPSKKRTAESGEGVRICISCEPKPVLKLDAEYFQNRAQAQFSSDPLSNSNWEVDTEEPEIKKKILDFFKPKLKEFFEFYPDESSNYSNSKIAICKLCNREPKKDSKAGSLKITKGSQGTCVSHLRAKHRTEFQSILIKNVTEIQEFIYSSSPAERIVDQKTFLDEVTKWIAHSSQPFTVVEDVYLRNVLNVLFNYVSGSKRELPKADFFRKNLDRIHANLETNKKQLLDSVDSKIAITVDLWTSKTQSSFMGITAHWVDDQFVLHSILLAFPVICGMQSADNIFSVFQEVVKKYNITQKISTITLDNTPENMIFIKKFSEWEETSSGMFKPWEANHVRCLAKIYHQVAQDIVTSMEKPISLEAHSLQFFLGNLNIPYPGQIGNPQNTLSDVITGQENPSSSESVLSKLQGFINSLKNDPKRAECLALVQTEMNLPLITPIPDGIPGWSSTFAMLEWVKLNIKAVSDVMAQFNFDFLHWELIDKLHSILKTLDAVTSAIASQKSLSLSSALVSMETIIDNIEAMASEIEIDFSFKDALVKGLSKLRFHQKDYHHKIFLIATVLHPSLRLKYFTHLKPSLAIKARAAIHEIYEEYSGYPPHKRQKLMSGSDPLETIFSQMEGIESAADELSLYLKGRSSEKRILDFWKNNRNEFPTLARIARDIFAIQGAISSLGVECNNEGNIMGHRRFSLGDDTFQKLKESQNALEISDANYLL